MMNNPSPYAMGRKLIEQPKVRARSSTQLLGVRKLPKPVYKLPLLVTGNGRSGTKWFSTALRKVGIHCPHEHCGEHGVVSWYFHTDSDWHPHHDYDGKYCVHVGERRSDFEFANVVHLVRNPLKTIGSIMAGMSFTNHAYVQQNNAKDYPLVIWEMRGARLLRSMYFAHAIWKHVESERDLLVQVENVEKRWPDVMKMVGLSRSVPLPEVRIMNKSYGIYKTKKITYADMEREDKLLARSIGKLAGKFGYK